MDRGTYAAASGGLLESRRLEIVANNLANVNTVGFKAERLVARQQEFSDTLASVIETGDLREKAKQDHARTPGVVDINTVTDFTPGPVAHNGNPLNVALREPNHFFVIGTPEGERYTRAGNFTLDATGGLVTPDGFPVLGQGGPITLNGSSASISSNGSVIVDQEVAGRIRTVQIDDTTALKRTEGVRFELTGGGTPSAVDTAVVPQSVEMPNVGVVQSMVEMMATQRSFEGYTKSLATIGELNDRALRTVAG